MHLSVQIFEFVAGNKNFSRPSDLPTYPKRLEKAKLDTRLVGNQDFSRRGIVDWLGHPGPRGKGPPRTGEENLLGVFS